MSLVSRTPGPTSPADGSAVAAEAGTSVGTTEGTLTLDFCPPSCEALCNVAMQGLELGNVLLYPTDVAAPTAVNMFATTLPSLGIQNVSSGQTARVAGQVRVRVDASRQVHTMSSNTYTLDLQIMGWRDALGRFD